MFLALNSAADFQKTGKNSYFFTIAYFNKPNSGTIYSGKI
jgi:hypothetical protein